MNTIRLVEKLNQIKISLVRNEGRKKKSDGQKQITDIETIIFNLESGKYVFDQQMLIRDLLNTRLYFEAELIREGFYR